MSLDIQDWDFYYYFVAFFTIVGGWTGICLLMYGKSTSVSLKWFAGTFVGYFGDLFILETMITLASKGE